MTFLPDVVLTGGVEIDYDEALGLFPSHTLVLGESQVSLLDVPGEPDTLYVANWITRPGERRRHQARALMDVLVAYADEHQVDLITHPDETWMEKRLIEVRGFEHDPSQPTWDGKPLIRRKPRS